MGQCGIFCAQEKPRDIVVGSSQGRLPGRSNMSVKKLSRSWLNKGEKKGIPYERNSLSKGQEARNDVVGLCRMLGFGGETLRNRLDHPLGSWVSLIRGQRDVRR